MLHLLTVCRQNRVLIKWTVGRQVILILGSLSPRTCLYTPRRLPLECRFRISVFGVQSNRVLINFYLNTGGIHSEGQ